MNEIAMIEAAQPDVNLARWMGRREAFNLVAGACTAADIDILRAIRDDKSYRSLGVNWADFCIHHVRVNRRTVDRSIANLNEFGPSFFLVTQMAYISAADYRRIARHVSSDAISVDGTMVALLPENRDAVSQAVTELLRRLEAEQPKPIPAAFDSLLKRCRNVADALGAVESDLDLDQRAALAEALSAIHSAAAALGVA